MFTESQNPSQGNPPASAQQTTPPASTPQEQEAKEVEINYLDLLKSNYLNPYEAQALIQESDQQDGTKTHVHFPSVAEVEREHGKEFAQQYEKSAKEFTRAGFNKQAVAYFKDKDKLPNTDYLRRRGVGYLDNKGDYQQRDFNEANYVGGNGKFFTASELARANNKILDRDGQIRPVGDIRKGALSAEDLVDGVGLTNEMMTVATDVDGQIIRDDEGRPVLRFAESGEDPRDRPYGVESVWAPKSVRNDNFLKEWLIDTPNDLLQRTTQLMPLAGKMYNNTMGILESTGREIRYGKDTTTSSIWKAIKEAKPYDAGSNQLYSQIMDEAEGRMSGRSEEEDLGALHNWVNFGKATVDGIGQIYLTIGSGGMGGMMSAGARAGLRSAGLKAIGTSTGRLANYMGYGYAAGSAMLGGYNSARQAGLTESEATLFSYLTGAVLYGTERLTGGQFMSRITRGRGMKEYEEAVLSDFARQVKSIGVETLKKDPALVENLMNRYAQKGVQLLGRLGSAAKGVSDVMAKSRVTKGLWSEGWQETMEEAGNIGLEAGYDRLLSDEEEGNFKVSFEDVVKRLTESGLIGGVTGGIGNLTNPYHQDPEEEKRQDEIIDLLVRNNFNDAKLQQAIGRLEKRGLLAPQQWDAEGKLLEKNSPKQDANAFMADQYRQQVKVLKQIGEELTRRFPQSRPEQIQGWMRQLVRDPEFQKSLDSTADVSGVLQENAYTLQSEGVAGLKMLQEVNASINAMRLGIDMDTYRAMEEKDLVAKLGNAKSGPADKLFELYQERDQIIQTYNDEEKKLTPQDHLTMQPVAFEEKPETIPAVTQQVANPRYEEGIPNEEFKEELAEIGSSWQSHRDGSSYKVSNRTRGDNGEIMVTLEGDAGVVQVTEGEVTGLAQKMAGADGRGRKVRDGIPEFIDQQVQAEQTVMRQVPTQFKTKKTQLDEAHAAELKSLDEKIARMEAEITESGGKDVDIARLMMQRRELGGFLETLKNGKRAQFYLRKGLLTLLARRSGNPNFTVASYDAYEKERADFVRGRQIAYLNEQMATGQAQQVIGEQIAALTGFSGDPQGLLTAAQAIKAAVASQGLDEPNVTSIGQAAAILSPLMEEMAAQLQNQIDQITAGLPPDFEEMINMGADIDTAALDGAYASKAAAETAIAALGDLASLTPTVIGRTMATPEQLARLFYAVKSNFYNAAGVKTRSGDHNALLDATVNLEAEAGLLGDAFDKVGTAKNLLEHVVHNQSRLEAHQFVNRSLESIFPGQYAEKVLTDTEYAHHRTVLADLNTRLTRLVEKAEKGKLKRDSEDIAFKERIALLKIDALRTLLSSFENLVDSGAVKRKLDTALTATEPDGRYAALLEAEQTFYEGVKALSEDKLKTAAAALIEGLGIKTGDDLELIHTAIGDYASVNTQASTALKHRFLLAYAQEVTARSPYAFYAGYSRHLEGKASDASFLPVFQQENAIKAAEAFLKGDGRFAKAFYEKVSGLMAGHFMAGRVSGQVLFIEGRAGTGKSSYTLSTILSLLGPAGVVSTSAGPAQRKVLDSSIAAVPGIGNASLAYEDLIAKLGNEPAFFHDKNVLIIDEVTLFTESQLDELQKALAALSAARPQPLKLLILGDTRQLANRQGDYLAPTSIKSRFLSPATVPLTIRFRTGKEDSIALQDYFDKLIDSRFVPGGLALSVPVTHYSLDASGNLAEGVRISDQEAGVKSQFQSHFAALAAQAALKTPEGKPRIVYLVDNAELGYAHLTGAGLERTALEGHVLTVEEAQGQEFDFVYVNLMPGSYGTLQANALFTAVSREKKGVHVFLPAGVSKEGNVLAYPPLLVSSSDNVARNDAKKSEVARYASLSTDALPAGEEYTSTVSSAPVATEPSSPATAYPEGVEAAVTVEIQPEPSGNASPADPAAASPEVAEKTLTPQSLEPYFLFRETQADGVSKVELRRIVPQPGGDVRMKAIRDEEDLKDEGVPVTAQALGDLESQGWQRDSRSEGSLKSGPEGKVFSLMQDLKAQRAADELAGKGLMKIFTNAFPVTVAGRPENAGAIAGMLSGLRRLGTMMGESIFSRSRLDEGSPLNLSGDGLRALAATLGVTGDKIQVHFSPEPEFVDFNGQSYRRNPHTGRLPVSVSIRGESGRVVLGALPDNVREASAKAFLDKIHAQPEGLATDYLPLQGVDFGWRSSMKLPRTVKTTGDAVEYWKKQGYGVSTAHINVQARQVMDDIFPDAGFTHSGKAFVVVSPYATDAQINDLLAGGVSYAQLITDPAYAGRYAVVDLSNGPVTMRDFAGRIGTTGQAWRSDKNYEKGNFDAAAYGALVNFLGIPNVLTLKRDVTGGDDFNMFVNEYQSPYVLAKLVSAWPALVAAADRIEDAAVRTNVVRFLSEFRERTPLRYFGETWHENDYNRSRRYRTVYPVNGIAFNEYSRRSPETFRVAIDAYAGVYGTEAVEVENARMAYVKSNEISEIFHFRYADDMKADTGEAMPSAIQRWADDGHAELTDNYKKILEWGQKKGYSERQMLLPTGFTWGTDSNFLVLAKLMDKLDVDGSSPVEWTYNFRRTKGAKSLNLSQRADHPALALSLSRPATDVMVPHLVFDYRAYENAAAQVPADEQNAAGSQPAPAQTTALSGQVLAGAAAGPVTVYKGAAPLTYVGQETEDGILYFKFDNDGTPLLITAEELDSGVYSKEPVKKKFKGRLKPDLSFQGVRYGRVNRFDAVQYFHNVFGPDFIRQRVLFKENLEVDGRPALGMVADRLITLSTTGDSVAGKVARHEALHYVLDYFLHPQEYARMIREGINRIRNSSTFRSRYDQTESGAHEMIADAFEGYGVSAQWKALPGWLQDVLRLFKHISYRLRYGKTITSLFDRIEGREFFDRTPDYDNAGGTTRAKMAGNVSRVDVLELSPEWGNESNLVAHKNNFVKIIHNYIYSEPDFTAPLTTLPDAVNNYVTALCEDYGWDRAAIRKAGLPEYKDLSRAQITGMLAADTDARQQYLAYLTVKHTDALKRFAFDYYNWDSGKGVKGYRYTPDEQVQGATGTAKARFSTEQSQIDALKTQSQHVREHLASTPLLSLSGGQLSRKGTGCVSQHWAKSVLLDAIGMARSRNDVSLNAIREALREIVQTATGSRMENALSLYLKFFALPNEVFTLHHEGRPVDIRIAGGQYAYREMGEPTLGISYHSVAQGVLTAGSPYAYEYQREYDNIVNAVVSSFKSIVPKKFLVVQSYEGNTRVSFKGNNGLDAFKNRVQAQVADTMFTETDEGYAVREDFRRQLDTFGTLKVGTEVFIEDPFGGKKMLDDPFTLQEFLTIAGFDIGMSDMARLLASRPDLKANVKRIVFSTYAAVRANDLSGQPEELARFKAAMASKATIQTDDLSSVLYRGRTGEEMTEAVVYSPTADYLNILDVLKYARESSEPVLENSFYNAGGEKVNINTLGNALYNYVPMWNSYDQWMGQGTQTHLSSAWYRNKLIGKLGDTKILSHNENTFTAKKTDYSKFSQYDLLHAFLDGTYFAARLKGLTDYDHVSVAKADKGTRIVQEVKGSLYNGQTVMGEIANMDRGNMMQALFSFERYRQAGFTGLPSAAEALTVADEASLELMREKILAGIQAINSQLYQHSSRELAAMNLVEYLDYHPSHKTFNGLLARDISVGAEGIYREFQDEVYELATMLQQQGYFLPKAMHAVYNDGTRDMKPWQSLSRNGAPYYTIYAGQDKNGDESIRPQVPPREAFQLEAVHPAIVDFVATHFANSHYLEELQGGSIYQFKYKKKVTDEKSYRVALQQAYVEFIKRQTEPVAPLHQKIIGSPMGMNAVSNEVVLEDLKEYYWDSAENVMMPDGTSYAYGDPLAPAHADLLLADPALKGKLSDVDATDGAQLVNGLTQLLEHHSYGGSKGIGVHPFIKFKGGGFSFRQTDAGVAGGYKNYLKLGTVVITDGLHRISPAMAAVNRRMLLGKDPSVGAPLLAKYQELGDFGKLHAWLSSLPAPQRDALKDNMIHFVTFKSGRKMGTSAYYKLADFIADVPVHVNALDSSGIGIQLELTHETDDSDAALVSQQLYIAGLMKENHQPAQQIYQNLARIAALGTEDLKGKIAGSGETGDPLYRKVKSFVKQAYAGSLKSMGQYGVVAQLARGEGDVNLPMLDTGAMGSLSSILTKMLVNVRTKGGKLILAPAQEFMQLAEAGGKLYLPTDVLPDLPARVRGLRYMHNGSATGGASGSAGGLSSFTEVVTANHYKKEFGLGNESVRQIFSLGGIDAEAPDYETLMSPAWREQLLVLVGSLPAAAQTNVLYKKALARAGGDPVLALEQLADVLISFNKTLYGIGSRIPHTGKNSGTPIRVVAFSHDTMNVAFVPPKMLYVQGADFDGDGLTTWLREVDETGNVVEGDDTRAGLLNRNMDLMLSILRDGANWGEMNSKIDIQSYRDAADEVSSGSLLKPRSVTSDIRMTVENLAGKDLVGVGANFFKTFGYYYQAVKRSGQDIAPYTVFGRTFTTLKGYPSADGSQPDGYTIDGSQPIYKIVERMVNAFVDNAKELLAGRLNITTESMPYIQWLVNVGMPENEILSVLNCSFTREAFSYIEKRRSVLKNKRLTPVKYFNRRVQEYAYRAKFPNDPLRGTYEEYKAKINSLTPADISAYSGSLANAFPDVAAGVSALAQEGTRDLAEQWFTVQFYNMAKPASEGNQITNLLSILGGLKTTGYDVYRQRERILKALGVSSMEQLEKVLNQIEGAAVVDLPKMPGASRTYYKPEILLRELPHLRAALRALVTDGDYKSQAFLREWQPLREAMDRRMGLALSPYFLSNKGAYNKLWNAFHEYLAGQFFAANVEDRSTPHYQVALKGKSYDLKDDFHRMAFVGAVREHFQNLKRSEGGTNAFLKALSFQNDTIYIEQNTVLSDERKVELLNHFDALSDEDKDVLFYYMLSHTGIRLGSLSLSEFIGPERFSLYNRYMAGMHEAAMSGRLEGVYSFLKDPDALAAAFMDRFAESAYRDGALRAISPANAEVTGWADEAVSDSYLMKYTAKRDNAAAVEASGVEELVPTEDSPVEEADENPQIGRAYTRQQRDSDGVRRTFLYKTRELATGEKKGADEGVRQFIAERVTAVTGRGYNAYTPSHGRALKGNLKMITRLNQEQRQELAATGRFVLNNAQGRRLNPGDKAVMAFNRQGIITTEDGQKVFRAAAADVKEQRASLIGRRLAGSIMLEHVARLKQAFPGIRVEYHDRSNPGRNALGWTQNGVVHLNMDLMQLDTPYHEFGHIYTAILRQEDRQEYDRIMRLAPATTIYAHLAGKYPELNDADLREETFVTLLGLKAAGVDLSGLVLQTPVPLVEKAIGFFHRFVARLMGNLYGRTLKVSSYGHYDLMSVLEAMRKDLLSGKVLSNLSSDQIHDRVLRYQQGAVQTDLENTQDLTYYLTNGVSEYRGEAHIRQEAANVLAGAKTGKSGEKTFFNRRTGKSEPATEASVLSYVKDKYDRLNGMASYIAAYFNHGKQEEDLASIWPGEYAGRKNKLDKFLLTDGWETFAYNRTAPDGIYHPAFEGENIVVQKRRDPATGKLHYRLLFPTDHSLTDHDKKAGVQYLSSRFGVDAGKAGVTLRTTLGDVKKLKGALFAMHLQHVHASNVVIEHLEVGNYAKDNLVKGTVFKMQDVLPSLKGLSGIEAFRRVLPPMLRELVRPDRDGPAGNRLFDAGTYSQSYLEGILSFHAFVEDTEANRTLKQDAEAFLKARSRYEINPQEREKLGDRLLDRQKSIRERFGQDLKGLASDPEYNFVNLALEEVYRREAAHDNRYNNIMQQMGAVEKFVHSQADLSNPQLNWVFKTVREAFDRIKRRWKNYKGEFNTVLDAYIKEYERRTGSMVANRTLQNTSRYFEDLFVYTQLPDAEGKMHRVNTLRLKPADELAPWQRPLVNFINARMEEQVKLHNQGLPANKQIPFRTGMMPFVKSPYSRSLFKGDYRLALEGFWNRFGNFENLYLGKEESMFKENPLGFLAQFGRSNDHPEWGSAYRFEAMGIKEHAGQMQVYDVDKHALMEDNLEVLLDMFMFSTNKNREIPRLVGVMEAAANIMELRKVKEGLKLDHESEFLKAVFDKLVYNENVSTKWWSNDSDWDKGLRNLKSVASTMTLGLNPLSAMSDFLGSMTSIFTAAMSGYYGKEYFDNKAMGQAIKTITAPGNWKLINALLDSYNFFDTDSGNLMQSHRHKRTDKSIFQSDHLMRLQLEVDRVTSALVLVSQLHHDGLWKYYSIRRDAAGGETLHYDLDAELSDLKAPEYAGRRSPQIVKKIQQNVRFSEGPEVAKAYDAVTVDSLKAIKAKLLGAMTDESAAMFETHAMLGFFSTFKRHLAAGWNRLYKVRMENENIQHYAMRQVEFVDDNGQLQARQVPVVVNRMEEGMVQSLLALRRELGEMGSKWNVLNTGKAFGSLEADQQDNLKKLVTDVALFALALCAYAGLSGDDEEEGRLVRQLKYSAFDIVGTYNLLGYSKSVQSAVPLAYAIKTTDTMINFLTGDVKTGTEGVVNSVGMLRTMDILFSEK